MATNNFNYNYVQLHENTFFDFERNND